MKLTVIGGGGVRSPLLIASTMRRAKRINLDEICLMDTNQEKLALLGALSRHVAERAGSAVRITTTGSTEEALQGARYIITTIRAGEDEGRVYDERIALKHGVLGQETTGPGGFAMAMRSIPAILDYAELAKRLAPGAWIFNFTNPAGLVAQALRDRGFSRSVGICDGANLAQTETAKWLDMAPEELRAVVYGLNHLSWTSHLYKDGDDILPALLENKAFLAGTSQRVFEPELVQDMGMWLNEYLYYYYYPEKALESIRANQMTRGEEVLGLNRTLLQQLQRIDPKENPEEALKAYSAYERRRVATYMHDANHNGLSSSMEEADLAPEEVLDLSLEAGEGYAGVALQIIESLETGVPAQMALNVPNGQALSFMRPDDVVEISCIIKDKAIQPLPVEETAEEAELLMRSVKLYERRAVHAILNRSRKEAIYALMAHPLVLSHSLSQALVDEYLRAHAPYVGDWS